MNLHDEIAAIAYELFKSRNGIPVRDLDDWLDRNRSISQAFGAGDRNPRRKMLRRKQPRRRKQKPPKRMMPKKTKKPLRLIVPAPDL